MRHSAERPWSRSASALERKCTIAGMVARSVARTWCGTEPASSRRARWFGGRDKRRGLVAHPIRLKPVMKPRTKFLIGGALVLSVSGFLMASSIRATAVYYLTPTELSTKLGADPAFRDAGVKVGARVVPGSINRLAGGKEYAF